MNVTRILAVGALAFLSTLAATPAAVAQDANGVLVVVRNYGYFDQHVYAIQGGQRRTIGFVTGLTTQRLQLPQAMAEAERDIQVYADPVAGGTPYLSQMLAVYPGVQVNVTLHTDAMYSSTTISDRDVEEEPETPATSAPSASD